jgi:hypothetical protein
MVRKSGIKDAVQQVPPLTFTFSGTPSFAAVPAIDPAIERKRGKSKKSPPMNLSSWSRDQRVLGLENGLPKQKERISYASPA